MPTTLAVIMAATLARSGQQSYWDSKQRIGGPSVHMHLFEMMSVRLRIDVNGIECTSYTSRSHQHLAEQFQGLRIAASRQCAHVPEYRPLGIEISGDNEKTSPVVIGGSNVVEQLLIDLARDNPL